MIRKCYAKTLRSAVKILCSITLDCTPPIFGSISSGNTRGFFIFVKELCWILKKNMISFSLYIWKTVNRYIYNVLMLRSMKVCVEGKKIMTNPTKINIRCQRTPWSVSVQYGWKMPEGSIKVATAPIILKSSKKVQRILCLFSLCIRINNGHRYRGRLHSWKGKIHQS